MNTETMNTETIIKIEFQRVNERKPKYVFRDWRLGNKYVRATDYEIWGEEELRVCVCEDQVGTTRANIPYPICLSIEQPNDPIDIPEVPAGIVPLSQLVFDPAWRRWKVEYPWGEDIPRPLWRLEVYKTLPDADANALEDYCSVPRFSRDFFSNGFR